MARVSDPALAPGNSPEPEPKCVRGSCPAEEQRCCLEVSAGARLLKHSSALHQRSRRGVSLLYGGSCLVHSSEAGDPLRDDSSELKRLAFKCHIPSSVFKGDYFSREGLYFKRSAEKKVSLQARL